MFDFILKKRNEAEVPKTVTPPSDKLAEKQLQKQTEIDKAISLQGQENLAVEFILHSEFPEARLQAAMHIESREALVQVGQAMRNIDRRVSKLVHEKLTKLDDQEKINSARADCLLRGTQLLELAPLLVNQVADWDKERLALGEHGASLIELKNDLEARLAAQLNLQRRSMEISAQLRSITGTCDEVQNQLSILSQQWQEIQADALSVSLPKNLISQLEDDFKTAQSQSEKPREVEPSIVEVVAPKKEKVVPSFDINAALTALEKALAEGSLQQALELDKSIRNANIPVRGSVAERQNALRDELRQLLDWAKWGSKVSREELIKTAENLPVEEMTASEIAKKVGGLRAHWKELDHTSGAANKQLWEQFDGACSKAYRVADAQFKQQAQLRHDNLAKAEGLIATIDEAKKEAEISDWKAHQQFIANVKLEWRKLGVIDRKNKARLDAEFNQKITALQQPLIEAQHAAIALRKQLIQSVESIQATDRDATNKIKQAQQHWRQEALSLPLERKDEERLWKQFRKACDAVFEQRKANAEEQHQRRDQLFQAQEACCAELENCTSDSSAELMKMITDAKRAWQNLSQQVSKHGSGHSLNARFDAALTSLKKRHSELLLNEKKAAVVSLREKINLCRRAENGETIEQATWESLPNNYLPKELTKVLTKRFTNAGAHQSDQSPSIAQFDEQLLRIELQRGIPSPPELAQQRLQLQVKELQSALKERDASQTYISNLCIICSLAINLTEQQEKRFQLILDNYAA